MLISSTRRRENEIRPLKRNKWRLLCSNTSYFGKINHCLKFIPAGRFHFGNWINKKKRKVSSFSLWVEQHGQHKTPQKQYETRFIFPFLNVAEIIFFPLRANHLAAAADTPARFIPGSSPFPLKTPKLSSRLPESSEKSRFDLAKVVLHSCPQRRGHGRVYLSKTAPES